jgi:predicted outer membrane repeat protein
MNSKSLLCVFIASLLCYSYPSAKTWYVKSDGSGDAPTIQAAIDSAAVADTVMLANGTYTGDGNRDIDYTGKAITVMSESGVPDSCIVDCEGSGLDPHRGLIFQTEEDTSSVLAGITISNGYNSYGSGIYCNMTSPKILNCIIKSNVISSFYKMQNTNGYGGAGMNINGGSPIIRDCTFQGNSTWGYTGGAIYTTGSPRITNCLFQYNGGEIAGGGMQIEGGGPVILGCEFLMNGAGNGHGAAISSYGSTIIRDCVFVENNALGVGGAICGWVDTLENCQFIENDGDWGAGVNLDNSVIIGCDFYENNPASQGGGAEIDNCVMIDCTFFHNLGEIGSGLYAGNSTIDNCTFYANCWGAQITVKENTSLVINNTIIAFGACGAEAVSCENASSASFSCCDIYGNPGGDWAGCIVGWYGINGNFSTDPLFCEPNSLDFRLSALSDCLPENNWYDCGVLVGAHGQGCDAPVAVGGSDIATAEMRLMQNYPNPFNPSTTISFLIPEKAHVNLSIYDVEGILIKTLFNEVLEEGYNHTVWNATDSHGNAVASGVYFYRLSAGGVALTKKMLLIR